MAIALKKLKIVIAVLAILLGLSLTALAGVIIYGQLDLSNGSAVVPDNYIEPVSSNEPYISSNTNQLQTTPILLSASVPIADFSRNVPVMTSSEAVITSDSAKETVISIFKNHAEDSEPFNCPNMFPGDRETNAYLVAVSHKGTVTVRFRADIRTGYEKLAEVLKCKVVLRDENSVLYDGLMCDMPESVNYDVSSVFSKTTELTYDITVYLDTSVGNEYMNKALIADFRWWVEESGDAIPSESDPDDTDPEDTTDSDNQSKPGNGELVDPPQTGDTAHFCFWFWIATFSLLMNMILLWSKWRGKYDKKEDIAANE